MAIQQIKNLINTQVEGPILKAKTQIKTEAKKEILKIKEQIPTKEDLKQQFLTAACHQSIQKKIDFLYNKIDKLLGKLEKISTNIREKISEIKAKIQKILEDILPKIALILGILALAVIVAKAIAAAIPAAEAANSVAPPGSPSLATRLRSFYEKAKKKIKSYGDAIKAFNKKIEKITKVVTTLLGIIFSVLTIIVLIGDKIALMRAFLLFLYLRYKSNCEINSPTGGLDSGTCNIPEYISQNSCIGAGGIWNNPNQTILNGNTNLLEVQAQITSLYEGLIEELELEGKTEVVETITNIMTQYKWRIERKIIPIT